MLDQMKRISLGDKPTLESTMLSLLTLQQKCARKHDMLRGTEIYTDRNMVGRLFHPSMRIKTHRFNLVIAEPSETILQPLCTELNIFFGWPGEIERHTLHYRLEDLHFELSLKPAFSPDALHALFPEERCLYLYSSNSGTWSLESLADQGWFDRGESYSFRFSDLRDGVRRGMPHPKNLSKLLARAGELKKPESGQFDVRFDVLFMEGSFTGVQMCCFDTSSSKPQWGINQSLLITDRVHMSAQECT